MDKDHAQYLLNKTKEDYNLIAEDFSNKRAEMWEELNSIVDYIKDGEKILDLGCGNGRLYEILKDKNIDYYGVDISEKLIEISRQKYPQAKFQVADALNLPFPEEFFDKVFGIAVLHHIPSRELRVQSLKEIKRILKPKGILFLTVWKFHGLKEKLLLLKFTIVKLLGQIKLDFGDIFKPWGKKTERYYHCFSKRELKTMVEEIGFNIRKISVVRNKRGNRQNILLIAEK